MTVSASPVGVLGRGAAFFDLDKTLMAGSSGIFFARAAYETGMISRGRLVRAAYENLRFRRPGSTYDRADDERRRGGGRRCGRGPGRGRHAARGGARNDA